MTWRERVYAAGQRGRFTQQDRLLARSWATCAVGEQRTWFPDIVHYESSEDMGKWFLVQHPFGIPRDEVLIELGAGPDGFFVAVNRGAVKSAEDLLDKIEDRVLELKRQFFA